MEIIHDSKMSNETTHNHSMTPTLSTEFGGWTNYQIIVSLVLGFISITTILANSLILFLFFKSKKALRLPSHFLLANLGVADLLVGLIVMLIFLMRTVATNRRWYLGQEMCWAFDNIHYMLCATSMFSMVMVAVERYVGVRYPLRHKIIVSKSRAVNAAVACWILAFSLTAIPLQIWPQSQSRLDFCPVNLRQPFLLFITFAVYWIPLFFTILVYVLIFHLAKKPFQSTLTQQTSDFPKSHKNEVTRWKSQPEPVEDQFLVAKKRQTRLAKKLSWVVVTMLIMFGPLFTALMLRGCDSKIFSINFLLISGWIRYANSCVNPFVFALNVPGYRREFYKLLENEGRVVYGNDNKEQVK